jgi:hypothetical protein
MSAAVLGGSRFPACWTRNHSQFGPEIGGLAGEQYLCGRIDGYTNSFAWHWRFQGAR